MRKRKKNPIFVVSSMATPAAILALIILPFCTFASIGGEIAIFIGLLISGTIRHFTQEA